MPVEDADPSILEASLSLYSRNCLREMACAMGTRSASLLCSSCLTQTMHIHTYTHSNPATHALHTYTGGGLAKLKLNIRTSCIQINTYIHTYYLLYHCYGKCLADEGDSVSFVESSYIRYTYIHTYIHST